MSTLAQLLMGAGGDMLGIYDPGQGGYLLGEWNNSLIYVSKKTRESALISWSQDSLYTGNYGGASAVDGELNTNNQMATSGNSYMLYATYRCYNLNAEGKTDWYLAARHEMEFVWTQMNALSDIIPQADHLAVDYGYWTSTEAYRAAYAVASGTGVAATVSKRDFSYNHRYVRPIRRVPL